MAATLAHFSHLPAAVSSASNRKLHSVRMSTRKISPNPSRAGTSNPSSFLALLSRFRRTVPHLLLNLPLAVCFTMQNHRYLSVAFNRRLPFRGLHHLVLGRPLRSPIPAHVNIVKLRLLLHHFESRHLGHDVSHPCRTLLPSDHRPTPAV